MVQDKVMREQRDDSSDFHNIVQRRCEKIRLESQTNLQSVLMHLCCHETNKIAESS